MAQRYLIAVPLSEEVRQKLNEICISLTGKPSTVRFPHITLVPPFTLNNNVTEVQAVEAIRSLPFSPFTASIEGPELFHQKERNILVIKIGPNDVFEQYANSLSTLLAPVMEIDTTPYTQGSVPAFRAHTTLEYNTSLTSVSGVQEKQNISWTIGRFGLYKEIGPGQWEPVWENTERVV